MKFWPDKASEDAANRGNATCTRCSQELGYILDETGVEHRPAFLVRSTRGRTHVILCKSCATS